MRRTNNISKSNISKVRELEANVKEVKKDIYEKVEDKLDLMVYLSMVQSSLKNNISSDYVLAKLPEIDRRYIIEMVSNAYYSRKLMVRMLDRKQWKWDSKTKSWEAIKTLRS